MAAPALKHTNEALAFLTLYHSMRPEIKEEVREMIVNDNEEEETKMLTGLSFEA